MPSVPALCKDISRAELKQYLKEYSTESGEKLFAAANVDMLEHLPMSTIYEASKSVAKWEPVANMLFPDSKAASEIFLIKVREARRPRLRRRRRPRSRARSRGRRTCGEAGERGRRGGGAQDGGTGARPVVPEHAGRRRARVPNRHPVMARRELRLIA